MALYSLEDIDIENIKVFLDTFTFTGNRDKCNNFVNVTNIIINKLSKPIAEEEIDRAD